MLMIGVLALQGGFAEHVSALDRVGVLTREVRICADLDGIAGLILPGGESTSITRLMRSNDLRRAVTELAHEGLPMWGTCAGLIVMSRVVGIPVDSMGLMDVDVRRNAYGRQAHSFEVDVPIPSLGKELFRAVFIRAPSIDRVGQGVETLAVLADDSPIAVRQANLLGSTFHPELRPDLRFHELFVNMAKERASVIDAAAV